MTTTLMAALHLCPSNLAKSTAPSKAGKGEQVCGGTACYWQTCKLGMRMCAGMRSSELYSQEQCWELSSA